MFTAICTSAYALVIAVLFITRARIGAFWSAFAFTVGTLLFLRFGFAPPLPGSIITLFGGTTVIAVLLYAWSGDESRGAFLAPIYAVATERRLQPLLIALLVVIPAALAWQSFAASLPASDPPPLVRAVHPAPPNDITLSRSGGLHATEVETVDLTSGTNPYRELETTDPSAFAERVGHGKTVYYQNCFHCHGDKLMADGVFASAMKPPPAKFDAGVLPMFQEPFFFWRIAKGGPGLPDEGAPWDSAMPAWEKALSQEEIWSVILYLYDRQGLRPRKKIAGHGEGS